MCNVQCTSLIPSMMPFDKREIVIKLRIVVSHLSLVIGCWLDVIMDALSFGFNNNLSWFFMVERETGTDTKKQREILTITNCLIQK